MIVFDPETEGLPVISQFSEYRISALLLQQVVVIAIVTWIEYDEYCMLRWHATICNVLNSVKAKPNPAR